ncbi:hypothetical protein [Xenorhabdus sp. SGI240]|uniref:hypothetical protein n=1 Tax=Xenorhabdus sp. SGI240 TaxID=3158262 RepID=UPI0032B7A6D4
MFFKIGSTIVSPEQENINIPVEVFKGNPKDGGCFITGLSPDVHIIFPELISRPSGWLLWAEM